MQAVRSDRRFLYGALALALAVRLLAFGAAAWRDPDCMLEPDSPTYEDPARALLQHGRFARSPGQPDVPELYRTPGYPAFIAGVYALCGPNRIALCLAQILTSLAPLAVVIAMARRLGAPGAGVWAALLLALEPMSLVASGLVLTETLFTALLALVLLVGLQLAAETECERRRAFALGLLLGLAALVRPLAYYLAIPLMAGAFCVKLRLHRNWKRPLALTAAIALPWLALAGGWQLRNHRVAGTSEFSLIKNVDLLLYRAAGVVALRDGTTLAEAQRRLESELPPPGSMSEVERNAAMGREARRIVLRHPLLTMRMSLAGAARLLAGPGLASLRDYFSLPLESRLTTLGLLGCSGGYLAVLYLLTLLGAAGCRHAPAPWTLHALLWGVVLYFVLVSSGPESYARFRVPIMPVLALYAGIGVTRALSLRDDSYSHPGK